MRYIILFPLFLFSCFPNFNNSKDIKFETNKWLKADIETDDLRYRMTNELLIKLKKEEYKKNNINKLLGLPDGNDLFRNELPKDIIVYKLGTTGFDYYYLKLYFDKEDNFLNGEIVSN